MMAAPWTTRKPTPWRAAKLSVGVTALALSASACGGVGMGSGEGSEESGESAETFYAGKQVELIVPFDPGGGTDTTARFLTPTLAEHVPGKPKIQVVNIPAGQGVVGSNEFATREPDGLSLYFSSASNTYPYIFGQEGVQYDYQDYEPIIGVPTGAVVYISPKTGVQDPSDLANLDKKLFIGGKSPAALDSVFLLIWDLLDLNVEVVFGMDSNDDMRVAFERGETNLDWQTTSAFEESVQPMVKAGDAVPLFTVGKMEGDRLVRDPAFPDIPTVAEVYEQIHGEPPSGPVWDAYLTLMDPGFTLQKVLWIHKDAPAAAIEALQQAATELPEDPQYQQKRKSILGTDPVVVGSELKSATAGALEIPEETHQWMIDYLNENYDAGL